MTNATRVVAGVISLFVSLLLGALTFFSFDPHTDLAAYALSLAALLPAAYASAVLFRARQHVGIKLACALAILVTLFWALEFFGGVAWYTLDKLARHYQHP